ncbi:hypothetical protein ABZ820_21405 [Streptomyces diacarni]|uniref:hypothetical protein n=1 Tax=Streptomyces diacarni TaxID=2800381 RepID=UPI0033C2982F
MGASAVAEGGAAWLRQELLDISSSLYPDRRPVVVRTWCDTVRLHEPRPVGRRHVLLVAVGGDARPASPDLDDVSHAFAAAGWAAGPGHEDLAGGRLATARRAGCAVRIHEGAGPGILTFTGWTPVEFTGRALHQPLFTTSTLDGVLCDDCHGWGICMDCEGTGRSDSGRSWGRCWCAAGNSGPGRCVECRGSGATPAAADGADDVTGPPVEEGHVSGIEALIDVAHRPCSCGELRCLWNNTLAEDGERLVARFGGACQGCGAQRSYAFALPHRELPASPPPPPPPCPRCGGTPVPVVGGLHLPGTATLRAQERGLVAAAREGCEVRRDDPHWQCASCRHRWRDADELRWAKVLRHVLDDSDASGPVHDRGRTRTRDT